MKKTKEVKKFISYFQSVITIGVMSSGKDYKEAEKEAIKKFNGDKGINYCHFDQTEFELTDSEEWNPELEVDEKKSSKDSFTFDFAPSKLTKKIIAERLHKDVSDLTQADYEEFIHCAIKNVLEH